jgi:hypothetical protein
MAHISVSIVHDEIGRIVSINRPADPARVTVLGGNGHSVLVTEVDEKTLQGLLDTHRVDTSQETLVKK